jgi:hypothetical protein
MEPTLGPLPAIGFLLAAAAVIGNDSLQTLGPFLAANRGRVSRPLQALFLCILLWVVLVVGWRLSEGDPAWGRLNHVPLPERFTWADLLPPLAVLALTRAGTPVSTSFLVLTAFAPGSLAGLLRQSLLGYGAALLGGFLAYVTLGWLLERPNGKDAPLLPESRPHAGWLAAQWLASGWLWGQWLIQDLANVYVYLPRRLEPGEMALSLAALSAGVCLLVRAEGGPIQKRLASKRPVQDPRSGTLIASVYGLILAGFASLSREPLSTTWVFLGLLAGRELALLARLGERQVLAVALLLGGDIARGGLGLAVSVAVALGVPALHHAS